MVTSLLEELKQILAKIFYDVNQKAEFLFFPK